MNNYKIHIRRIKDFFPFTIFTAFYCLHFTYIMNTDDRFYNATNITRYYHQVYYLHMCAWYLIGQANCGTI